MEELTCRTDSAGTLEFANFALRAPARIHVNPQSAIRNPKSEIRNPQSKIAMIQLLRIGRIGNSLLRELRPQIARQFGMVCEIHPAEMDPGFAFHPERQQYWSTEILARMQRFAGGETWRLLGVTEVDLYIPILTFVFGEAQFMNTCALVSTRRLYEEFYGLPRNVSLLTQRLVKESIHELGHTQGLVHCSDYRCSMSASHSVEAIDLKEARLCASCLNGASRNALSDIASASASMQDGLDSGEA